jgi:Rab GDP dissociation inhibitor
MDQEYDVIIMGTGLKECILSGLLAVKGKKVLHIDRNHYYGGESASLNLKDLFLKFKPNTEANEGKLGKSKYYNIDLCPKFIMACGNLVKLLLYTQVTRYLQFKSVAGSFVVKDDKIHKVPASPSEALGSSLMGIFQKNKYKNFLQYVTDYKQNEPSTHKGYDATKATTKQVFEYWGLDENTQAFTGHSVALWTDDSYLNKPFKETLERINLYAYSVSQYGNSPYIYPVYGLGGLPESFSRLSAVYQGTFILRQAVDEVLYGEDGKVTGVRSGNDVAKCKQLIGDPSYFQDTPKVRKNGQVAKWLFILNHPVNSTNGAHSAQIIIPAKHSKRNSDVYISVISAEHQVAAPGKYVAMIQGNVETSDPKKELAFAARLLGDYEEDFFFVTDLYEPTSNGVAEQVFITESYDSTSHFESATNEVIELYERITGEKLDLSKPIGSQDLNNE